MDSRELHDQILRLDRSLGAFLDSLYKLRDSSGVIIALTGVLEVEMRDSLASALARRKRLRSQMDPLPARQHPVVAVVTRQPYSYWGSSGATHGSPHDYDAHVPGLFYGDPFRPGTDGEFARVIDMAPTLATALGVTPTERLDGHVLRGALR